MVITCRGPRSFEPVALLVELPKMCKVGVGREEQRSGVVVLCVFACGLPSLCPCLVFPERRERGKEREKRVLPKRHLFLGRGHYCLRARLSSLLSDSHCLNL